MFDGAKEVVGGLGHKFTNWRAQRKEHAAIRKMEKAAAKAHDPHAHSRFWLLNVPALSTICAATVEWYWAVLFCLAATGRLAVDWATSVGSNTAPAGAWHFALDIQNVAVLVGLILATAPIVMLSMVWLPVQFAMRGAGRFRRGTLIVVGILANLLVIVSGTVVMNQNRQGQVRADLVVEQRGDAGRAAIVARRNAVHQRWVTLTEPSNTTLQAQAARAGVAGWDSYIATARQQATAGTITPQRLALIERARGSAVAAEAYQQQEDALTGQIAAAAPAAATAAHVQDDVGANMDWFAQRVEVYRPPFVAFICTLIGIFGAWWTLAMLERLNPRDVLRSGWADEGHRIEDLRGEEVIDSAGRKKAVEPMKPPRRKFTEADTGEEIEETLIPAHYRKLKPRGKPVPVAIKPEPQPDEAGVPPELDNRDSELKASAHNEMSAPSEDRVEEPSKSETISQSPEQEAPEHVTFSEEDLASIAETFADAPVDEPDADEHGSDGAEADDGGEHLAAPQEEPSSPPPEAPMLADTPAEQEAAANQDEPEQQHHNEPPPETREDRLLMPPAPESVAAE